MNTYKLKISYIGQSYEGWQIQPVPHKTIQGELNRVLKKLVKSDHFSTMGSGRTDSGVHAIGQIVKASLPFEIEESGLMKGLNSGLPSSIRVLECEKVEKDFHPTKDAKSKCYRYILYEAEMLPPFLDGRVTLVRPGIDWDLLERSLTRFVGEKDFINFSTKGTEVSSTIRSIYSAKLIREGLDPVMGITLADSNLFELQFTGSGFLKQMIRLIVGAALDIGRGKKSIDDLNQYFEQELDNKFAAVSPPDGLYLDHVIYE